jgi:hypothetical protein
MTASPQRPTEVALFHLLGELDEGRATVAVIEAEATRAAHVGDWRAAGALHGLLAGIFNLVATREAEMAEGDGATDGD